MCGIAGMADFEDPSRVQVKVLRAMAEVQTCRGPDAEGFLEEPGIGFAHRRLSVIDLQSGGQPMRRTLVDGSTLAITYSGEVYNFRDLRTELVAAGHRFVTNSDTEVVLVAYQEWGDACVEHLIGMFAFGIWDGARRRLLLARDRLGVKPLHWAQAGSTVVFGSEIKAVLCHPAIEARIDADSVAALFSLFGVHRPGRTPLVGVNEVAPGHLIVVDRDGIRDRTWWELEAVEHRDDADTTTGHLASLLDQAVTGQLFAEVPMCALLSGGLDSSAIVAIAHEWLADRGERLATRTVDIAGNGDHFRADADRPDIDTPYVEELLSRLSTDHRHVVVQMDDMWDTQVRATRARDLPAMGDLDATLLRLFESVTGEFTVALSGEAADEVFGGYAWFHDAAAIARAGFPWMRDDIGLGNVLAPELRDRIDLVGRVRAEYATALAAVPQTDEQASARRYREASHLALTRFLPVLLDRKDRTSMAVGVEVRVPFCDHRLVEYVWNVPWELRHPGGQVKGLLRNAVRDRLPAKVVDRPKAMFPAVADPAYDELLEKAVSDVLAGSRLAPLLDHDKVRSLAEGRTPRPRWQRRLALAYLAQAASWMQHYDVQEAI